MSTIPDPSFGVSSSVARGTPAAPSIASPGTVPPTAEPRGMSAAGIPNPPAGTATGTMLLPGCQVEWQALSDAVVADPANDAARIVSTVVRIQVRRDWALGSRPVRRYRLTLSGLPQPFRDLSESMQRTWMQAAVDTIRDVRQAGPWRGCSKLPPVNANMHGTWVDGDAVAPRALQVGTGRDYRTLMQVSRDRLRDISRSQSPESQGRALVAPKPGCWGRLSRRVKCEASLYAAAAKVPTCSWDKASANVRAVTGESQKIRYGVSVFLRVTLSVVGLACFLIGYVSWPLIIILAFISVLCVPHMQLVHHQRLQRLQSRERDVRASEARFAELRASRGEQPHVSKWASRRSELARRLRREWMRVLGWLFTLLSFICYALPILGLVSAAATVALYAWLARAFGIGNLALVLPAQHARERDAKDGVRRVLARHAQAWTALDPEDREVFRKIEDGGVSIAKDANLEALFEKHQYKLNAHKMDWTRRVAAESMPNIGPTGADSGDDRLWAELEKAMSDSRADFGLVDSSQE